MANTDYKIILDVLIDQAKSQAEINKLIKQIQAKSKIKFGIEIDSSSVTKLTSELNRLTKASTMQAWADNNSKAMRKYGSEINELILKFRNLDKEMTLVESQKLQADFKSIQLAARQAGDIGAAAGEKLHKAWDKSGGWSNIASSLLSAIRSVRDGAKLIGEFDDAMTNVAYTSDITSTGLEKLGNQSMQMGKNLHTSAKNILEAVKIYSAANSTADDILRKARPAIMLSNATAMNSSESPKTIDTALNQFKLNDTEKGSVGFEIAGMKQLNILNSLLGSWKEYEAIMADIDDRTGITFKSQETYADSLKGLLGKLISGSISDSKNLGRDQMLSLS